MTLHYYVRWLIICKQTPVTQQSKQQVTIMQRRTLTTLVSTLVLAAALPDSVLAQTYPIKPIKFIVPHTKTGVNNFQDFFNIFKSKPGNFTSGSSGIGSTHHLTMEALKAAMQPAARHKHRTLLLLPKMFQGLTSPSSLVSWLPLAHRPTPFRK